MSATLRPPDSNDQYHYTVTDAIRSLTAEDLEFICRYTGKQEDIIRPHIPEVWKKIKEQCWVFKCIQELFFLKPRISLHPFYPMVKAAQQQGKGDNLLHLDIGCCFGQDTRQLITDGWKQSHVTALDLVPDYWNMGKVLFMDQDSLKVPFLAGSMTDDAFISAQQPATTPTGHLVGKANFAWAGAVLHVLSKADCEKFLGNVQLLLKPGGSLYGWSVGRQVAGEWAATPDGKKKRWLHSPETLEDLLLHVGFSSAKAEPNALQMLELEHLDNDVQDHMLMCFIATK